MIHREKTLHAFARLLSYPTEEYIQSAELLYVIFSSEMPEAATKMATFGDAMSPLCLNEQEELFASTFDINPPCALEVGWHLFGEEHLRGQFLVRMREEIRRYNLPESAELPDHMLHVLAVIAAMPNDEAIRLVHSCIFSALKKMEEALKETETSYGLVISALSLFLVHEFGEPEIDEHPDHLDFVNGQPQFSDDPLHAYPMPNSGCSSNLVEFVPLHIDYHSNHSSIPTGEGHG
ncbi:hypothetical protein MNBD_PLANCTO02-425 [hydrothermal vent metagenome]|uniref:Nitrate reductase n=1 Tax=hydrothermal vent metagenome TaxID=652676 RepID=A0A3B1DY95_9ZZZZ